MSTVALSSRVALASETLLRDSLAGHLRRVRAGITARPFSDLTATMDGRSRGLAIQVNKTGIGTAARLEVRAIGTSRPWVAGSRHSRQPVVRSNKIVPIRWMTHVPRAACAGKRRLAPCLQVVPQILAGMI